MHMPLTALQIARKTRLELDTCSSAIVMMARMGIVNCLNPSSKNCRVYRLTEIGMEIQKSLESEFNVSRPGEIFIPEGIDWELYGLVCYRQRSAVIQAITQPMQPCQIKRYLRIHRPQITISQNNIRDIMREFLKYGIVQKVFVRKKAHPQYELTDSGLAFQKLLNQADMPL